MGNTERHLPGVLKTINARLAQAENQVGKLVVADAQGNAAEVQAITALAAALRDDRDWVVAAMTGGNLEAVVDEVLVRLRGGQEEFRALVPVTARAEKPGPPQAVKAESLVGKGSVGDPGV